MIHGLDFIIFFVIFINVLLCILIILKNKKAKINQLYVAFVASLNFWIISNFFENKPELIGINNLGIFLRLDFAFALLFLYYWFRFCSAFIQSKLESRPYQWINRILFLFCIIFIFLSLFTQLIITDPVFYEGVIHFKGGILWPLYAILIFFWLAGGLAALWLGKKGAKDEGRVLQSRQINFIFFGFAISIGIGAIVNIPQAFFPISLEVSRLGLYGMIFLTSFTAYAIARHQFMDIRLIIARSIAYLLLIVSLGIIYCSGLFLVTSFITRESTTISTLSISTILALIIAFSFQPLLVFFQKITNRIFYKQHYDETQLFHSLALAMASTVNLSELTNKLLNKILTAIHISCGAFVLVDNKKIFHLAYEGYAKKPQFSDENLDELIKQSQIVLFDELPENSLKEIMRKLKISIIVPLRAKEEYEDILILGEKLSGTPYTNQDIHFFEVFAPEAAVAIKNVANVERLLRLDEAKSEFITVVSHQLRTPLSVARWNFELLLEKAFGTLTVKIENIIQSTYQAMMVLNQGINNLMATLEIEEGKEILKPENVEINQEVIKKAVDGLKNEIQLKNMTIKQRLSFKNILKIDRQKILRVFEILLDNAVRYSPVGSTVIISTSWRKKETQNELLVSIEDEGIGVPEGHKELIFQKFFRGEEAKKMSTSGFGLGLFTAKSYIKLHGGRLWIDKKQGPGSVFRFSLPMTEKTPQTASKDESE